jgi:hypothetical protein
VEAIAVAAMAMTKTGKALKVTCGVVVLDACFAGLAIEIEPRFRTINRSSHSPKRTNAPRADKEPARHGRNPLDVEYAVFRRSSGEIRQILKQTWPRVIGIVHRPEP